MLDRGLSGIYHVVSSERISKYEFAKRLAATFNLETGSVVPMSIGAANLRAPRPVDPSLNTAKAASALGRPMPDVDSGLRRFRDLYLSAYHEKVKSFLVR